MSNLNKKKVAVVFISGSAGELDWILPILDYLLQKKSKIKIIFRSRHALESVEKQTYQNIQVIVINDGAEELARSICEENRWLS